uniref:Uncharacterized protein n=1 Tax=viral metagenome TaxID=1070528 RepID=A0A6C0IKA5_9ZZZZ
MYFRTSLVINNPSETFKQDKNVPFFYRECNCDTNLTSNTPVNQYQRQKIIQNTVRVPSSLYLMNLAALNVYQKPKSVYSVIDVGGTNYTVSPGVNWNQMSDRKEPHLQPFTTSSGSSYGGSSTRRSLTRLRPGAMSPGGAGVDIKHNSYDRYLNRIKGRAPLKHGGIPATFGVPNIPFIRNDKIYGAKTFKTNIVNGCNCLDNDDIIYNNQYTQKEIYNLQFSVGQIVYAKEGSNDYYTKATITTVNNYNDYFIQFEGKTSPDSKHYIMQELRISLSLNCNSSETFITERGPDYGVNCLVSVELNNLRS